MQCSAVQWSKWKSSKRQMEFLAFDWIQEIKTKYNTDCLLMFVYNFILVIFLLLFVLGFNKCKSKNFNFLITLKWMRNEDWSKKTVIDFDSTVYLKGTKREHQSKVNNFQIQRFFDCRISCSICHRTIQ